MNKFSGILDGMQIADISLSEGGYNYYGYVRHNGEWVILRENTAQTEYRVTMGADSYSTAWTARTTQNYKYPTIG